MQLNHGGRLQQAARDFQIPLCDWLDLSTGISPWSWPIPSEMPQSAWQRLPDAETELCQAACRYYGAPRALPVAGSQAAIRALPWVRKQLHGLGRVALPLRGYREHRQAWERAGFDLCFYRGLPSADLVAGCAVVVVIHPNNPLGEQYAPEALQTLQNQLAAKNGWLLVDEAFLDPEPRPSLAATEQDAGLIVLRSVGKFFGLAGLRAGFVLAEGLVLEALAEELGPWTLNGPASWLLPQALADHSWHHEQCARLQQASASLAELLHQQLPDALSIQGTALFQTVLFNEAGRARALYQALAHQGVLVRLLDEGDGLRFGLPRDSAERARLQAALEHADKS